MFYQYRDRNKQYMEPKLVTSLLLCAIWSDFGSLMERAAV